MMTSDNSTTSSIAIASIATTLTMIGLATAGALGYYFGCSGDHQRHPPKNDTDQSMHKDFSRSTTSESWNAKIECEHALIDVRIAKIRPLIPPAILHEEIPNHTCSVALVQNTRHSISKILDGPDDRLLVVVGPCSIHDTVAAMDYAKRLKKIRDDLKGDLEILMRVYFEKPRTAVGWKGLINDPDLNGTFNINKGLRVGRNLLLDINDLGLPVGCEFLDTISPQFTADLGKNQSTLFNSKASVSWTNNALSLFISVLGSDWCSDDRMSIAPRVDFGSFHAGGFQEYNRQ